MCSVKLPLPWSAARFVRYCVNLQMLSAGCKALLAVLLSTPSGVAYLVQQREASQSLITALHTRYTLP